MHIDIHFIVRFVLTIVNFIILYFALRHFLFKPVTTTIASREDEIKGNIKKAEEDKMKAEQYKNENETLLKQARQEGKSIVEEYKVKAQKLSDEVVKEANEEAQVIMNRARKDADREREMLQAEVKHQAIELAILLSSRAMEQTIDEGQHRKLIEDFIAKVGT